MFQEYEEIILQTALFHGIERNGLLTMLECLKPTIGSYHRNDIIVMSGDVFESVGMMLKGEATVSKENAAGNRTVMTVLEPGDIFGEMVAFSSQSTWPATVQAQGTCRVLFLARGKIVGECSKMCPWHRSLIQNFLKVISEKALMLNKKVEYLTIKSIRGKISTFLLELSQKTGEKNIILPLKRNELADYLNVARPSLSREIARMKEEGVIDYHLNTFRIINVEALKSMSDL